MSTRPGRFYLQHHDVEAPRLDATAFRAGWRISSRLDRLLADGLISAGTWQAAIEYRDDWSIAAGGPSASLPFARISSRPDPHAVQLARIAAVKRLRRAEARIGGFAARLVFLCAVDDCPWAEIGRILHRNPETVRDWTASALTALVLAWRR